LTSVLQARSWLPRTEGMVRLGFARRDDATVLADLHQAGAGRVRFPSTAEDCGQQAVLLNTAGGLTGGDRMDVAVRLAAGAEATVTTAAAEKIYRAREGETEVAVTLALGAGSRLAWLPQPTILFDRSRLRRCTTVELAADASLVAAETLIFGRMAMGEDVRRGACRDIWRVRREGVLVFADALRVEGAIADALDRPATLAGARAVAMLLYAAPDAGARIDKTRALLESAGVIGGASAWNGMLLVRAIAGDGRTLQQAMAPLIEWLSGRPLPRVWRC
jgi:urease accessory protein